MAKRFSEALGIQEGGASNPSGIARTLKEACHECIEEGVQQGEDPAVRLIVHQLAHLCNVYEIDHTTTVYGELMETCRQKASQ